MFFEKDRVIQSNTPIKIDKDIIVCCGKIKNITINQKIEISNIRAGKNKPIKL